MGKEKGGSLPLAAYLKSRSFCQGTWRKGKEHQMLLVLTYLFEERALGPRWTTLKFSWDPAPRLGSENVQYSGGPRKRLWPFLLKMTQLIKLTQYCISHLGRTRAGTQVSWLTDLNVPSMRLGYPSKQYNLSFKWACRKNASLTEIKF